jgi:hypothetical protein
MVCTLLFLLDGMLDFMDTLFKDNLELLDMVQTR